MNLTTEDLLSIAYVRVKNVGALEGKMFSGVSTDSRTVQPGQVFIALRGETYDGHKFVPQAFGRGAACAIVDRSVETGSARSMPMLIVKNTTTSLGALANAYRKKFDIPVVAVAGSNGKTTTKEMVASVLNTKYNVLSTEGNLNNHIGVPQTMFRLNAQHDVAVVEIGTNHFGELGYLCDILLPTHGLITNIGREHLQFFKNISGVARAEGELFDALSHKGTGFVNLDDDRVVRLASELRSTVSYGFGKKDAQVSGTVLGHDHRGCFSFSVRVYDRKGFRVQLTVPGRHVMQNALAAAAVGVTFDIPAADIRRALKAFSSVSKRMEMRMAGGVTILNDTYNANPDSVLSALETVRMMKCKGKKVLILADMLEMGSGVNREHEGIGRAIKQMGFHHVLTFGNKARRISEKAMAKFGGHYEKKRDLSVAAAASLAPGDIVLIKGSRGMKMEEIAVFLVNRLGKRSA